MPLTRREIDGQPSRSLAWETDRLLPGLEAPAAPEFWQRVLRGFYPETARNPARDYRLWQASYVQTYLERDVRNLRNLGDLTLFQAFLRALAARSAQLLNLSEIARDIGVAANTARDWLSILEATFQVFLLRPYFANIGKRLVKSPKIYFMDTGILCYLVGLREPLHAVSGPMGGALFENLVVAEIYKTILHQGEQPRLYFWRTATGSEVDILIELQGKLIPVEIKLSATPRPEMGKGISDFKKDFGEQAALGYVIHPGKTLLPLGGGALALPFAAM
jgi:hypothetical protein